MFFKRLPRPLARTPHPIDPTHKMSRISYLFQESGRLMEFAQGTATRLEALPQPPIERCLIGLYPAANRVLLGQINEQGSSLLRQETCPISFQNRIAFSVD
jgi:hypothetical protein